MANNEPTSPNKPSPRWRWIISNADGVHGFTMPPKMNAVTNVLTPDGSHLSIQPGANLVEVKRWEALKKADPADRKDAEGNPIPHCGEIHRLLTTKIPRAGHKNRQPEMVGQKWMVEGAYVPNASAPLEGLDEAEAIEIVNHFEIGVAAGDVRGDRFVQAMLKIEKRPAVNEALHRVLEGMQSGNFQAAAG